MKKLILIKFFCLGIFSLVYSNANAQCATETNFQEQVKKDPSLLLQRMRMEKQMKEGLQISRAQRTSADNNLRVIPVVVHVLYKNDVPQENVSDQRIFNMIRDLNKDFKGLNKDTNNIPDIKLNGVSFRDLAARSNIEFRLATKDTRGFCTNGIIRQQSDFSDTVNLDIPNDTVKIVSPAWDATKYFNIWIVKSIQGGPQGQTILGYAQFPWELSTRPATDGVVLVAGVVNGTPTNRTLTHEAGHWLGLRHIWGDTQCGDDGIDDTPTHFQPNFGGSNGSICSRSNPFNRHNGCATGDTTRGEMYMNYMDYSDAACQMMFSKGQKRMTDFVLDTIRRKMWQPYNLKVTGTDNSFFFSQCATKFACVGSQSVYQVSQLLDTSVAVKWLFPGGSPAISTDRNPTISYNTAGFYDASVIIGSDTVKRPSAIYVGSSSAWYGMPFSDGFNYTYASDNGWVNINEQLDASSWTLAKGAIGYGGDNCMKLNNYDVTGLRYKDALITPPLDFSYATSGNLIFKTALAKKIDQASNDTVFRVWYSVDCGAHWDRLKNGSVKGYTEDKINSAGFVSGKFTPNNKNLWMVHSIPLSTANLLSKPNVLLKFEFSSSATSNNFYFDDLEFSGTVGINDNSIASNLNFEMFPNPAEKNTSINFNLLKTEKVKIDIYDILGKEVSSINENVLNPGTHKFDVTLENKGVYFVKLQVGGSIFTKKVIIN